MDSCGYPQILSELPQLWQHRSVPRNFELDLPDLRNGANEHINTFFRYDPAGERNDRWISGR